MSLSKKISKVIGKTDLREVSWPNTQKTDHLILIRFIFLRQGVSLNLGIFNGMFGNQDKQVR